jgi:hypothetical protein
MLDAVQHLGAEKPRHLDVQEHEVGSQRIDRRDGLRSVGRFTDAGQPFDVGQHVAQTGTRHRFVVSDQDRDLHSCSILVRPQAGSRLAIT